MRPGVQQLDLFPTDRVGLRIVAADADELVELWPAVQDTLAQDREALHWQDYYTLESIAAALIRNQMQLWVLDFNDEPCGFMISELVAFPQCIVLRMLLASGEQNSLINALQFLDTVEIWAKQMGATRVEIIGRPGWRRVLEPHGYEQRAVLLTRSLAHVWEH